jgi:hypothetical protein
MTKIILTVTGWLIRKFGLLLLLILTLSLASSVKDWRIVEDFQPETVISDVVNQRKGIENNSTQEIKDRLAQKKTERVQLEQISCILPICTLYKNARIYRADAEIEVLSEALSYGAAVARGAQTCQEYQQNQPSVNQRRQAVQEFPFWFFWLPEGKSFINQLDQLEIRQTELLNSCQHYRAATKTFQANQRAIKKTLDTRYTNFLTRLNEFKKSKEQTLGQILVVLPSALWLLLGIILTPIGFKTFAYYGIAPLATRKFGIRLQPSMSGELRVLSPNNYLQRITLKEGEEFLFDPRLLRSAPYDAHKSTKYVLDWSMPLTSIASGMYFLTKISSDNEGTVTVGCDNDSNGNILRMTVLEIPENSSIVLQPRCLAGVVQNSNHPIKITKHWRLGNLSSWLTLQLRYVVFHGPSKLVLKGNNGIEVDPTNAGTTLNQAATLGFSANLSYSVSRCETFYSYYSGKMALLDDRFSSGPGFYLHEVSPGKGSKGPLRQLTRPFEIVWDVLTNAMGI